MVINVQFSKGWGTLYWKKHENKKNLLDFIGFVFNGNWRKSEPAESIVDAVSQFPSPFLSMITNELYLEKPVSDHGSATLTEPERRWRRGLKQVIVVGVFVIWSIHLLTMAPKPVEALVDAESWIPVLIQGLMSNSCGCVCCLRYLPVDDDTPK